MGVFKPNLGTTDGNKNRWAWLFVQAIIISSNTPTIVSTRTIGDTLATPILIGVYVYVLCTWFLGITTLHHGTFGAFFVCSSDYCNLRVFVYLLWLSCYVTSTEGEEYAAIAIARWIVCASFFFKRGLWVLWVWALYNYFNEIHISCAFIVIVVLLD